MGKGVAMTTRERILSAMKREQVDRVPCCVIFNPLQATSRKGYTWNFPWPSSATLQEQVQYQVEGLGLDQIINAGIHLTAPVSGVTSRTWIEEDILHKSYDTPAGELHASVRYNENWPHGQDIPFYSDFNVGHFVEPWIQNDADLAAFTQIVRLCDTREMRDKTASEMNRAKQMAQQYHLPIATSVGMGLTGAQHLFGAEGLCMMTVDNPGLVDAYMEHEHQINLRAIEVLSGSDVDIVRRNGFYETADFFGPKTLEQFVGPRVRREADAVRAVGMVTSYTVHTGVAPILSYLSSLTVDTFFGIDIAFQNIDLDALKRELCPNKGLWIGPSSTFHLWNGPDATRKAVQQVFETFGKTGIILSPGVSAHSIMPWESTLAMIDEWKKWRYV